MTPSRIIAPVTFAEDSYEAVGVAAALAAALGAELVLAGIVPTAMPEPLLDTPDVERLAHQTQEQQLLDRLVTERLEDLTRALPRSVRARTLLASGPVGSALVAAAREQDADLIVVPIHRESELAHIVHDHADRYVLHHSDVPVLVVPTGAHDTAQRNGAAG
ncbi:MAG: Universal stress protein family [Solirubrobacteraceae bacterium]|nr:Universal stress protein family [Solirubrobacteraceae bacterium]